MNVEEQLDELRPPEVTTELIEVRAASVAAPAPEPATMWLRIGLAIQFWIALIAIFFAWSEVGGQGHLDMMPWYSKLACGVTLAWCCTRLTGATIKRRRAFNWAVVRWSFAIALIVAIMAGITYY